MKIKKLPNSEKVIVEFDELLSLEDTPQLDHVVELLSTVARRTSYNMWEFKTLEAAQNHVFMLKLKL